MEAEGTAYLMLENREPTRCPQEAADERRWEEAGRKGEGYEAWILKGGPGSLLLSIIKPPEQPTPPSPLHRRKLFELYSQ